MGRYRGERWLISYGIEDVFGEAPAAGRFATNIFGVMDDCSLPDPTFEHQPWWMMNPANRNYYVAYKGKARSEGSIPNITLLDGRPLFLPIANKITHAEGILKNGTGIATGAPKSLAVGANEILVTGLGTFMIYLPPGNTGTATSGTTTVTGTPVSLVAGYNTITTTGIAGSIDVTVVGTGTANSHIIDETINLSSIRVVAVNIEDDTVTPDELVRWFVGGKVNRATFRCDEGGVLMMSLDNIAFKMPYFTDSQPYDIKPWYNVHAIKQTLTYPCTEPYYFSHGSIKMKVPYLGMTEVTIPSVRSFTLEVNNGLDPKYYIATNAEKVPYEIHEGRREYRLALQVDLIDDVSGFTKDTPFLELLNQGMDTVFKGAAIDITFTRGANDYIHFVTPADYNPQEGGESQGSLIVGSPTNIVTEPIVSVPIEMVCRNLKIVVKDGIAGANYPV